MADEKLEAKKINRHERVALNHLTTLRLKLVEKRAILNQEIEKLDAAILALE
ncbi:MAG: hypothetical protein ACYCOU_03710 [Sulfobacillus sp.]